MYLLQLIAIAIYAILTIAAYFDFKRTVIAWIPLSMLFNPQVCILYFPQAISLALAVNVTLCIMYYLKFWGQTPDDGNDEPFGFLPFMLAMGASYMISTICSIIPLESSLNKIIKNIAIIYFIIFVFFRCINSKDDIRFFAKVSIFVSFLITIDGLIEWITHINPAGDFIYLTSPHDDALEGRTYYLPSVITGEFRERYGMTRAYSFFSLHIKFGVACVLLFFFFLVSYRERLDAFRRADILNKLVPFVLVMLVIGVICSNSKTPMLGFIVVVLIAFNYKIISNLQIFLPLIIGIILIEIFLPEYLNNIFSLTDEQLAAEGGGSTIATREMQFQSILKLFEQSPIVGNGINAAGYFSKNVTGFEEILGAESQWFKLLADQGIIGIIAYLYMYYIVYSYCKNDIPSTYLLSFLLSIMAMETATGGIEMQIWLPLLIVIKRYYQLEANPDIEEEYEGQEEQENEYELYPMED